MSLSEQATMTTTSMDEHELGINAFEWMYDCKRDRTTFFYDLYFPNKRGFRLYETGPKKSGPYAIPEIPPLEESDSEDEGICVSSLSSNSSSPMSLNSFPIPVFSQLHRPKKEPKLKPDQPEATPKQLKYCSFCIRNGESFEVYFGHNTRDKRGKIICPKLKMLICSRCGDTGILDVHTEKMCTKPFKPSPTYLTRNGFNVDFTVADYFKL